MSFLKLDSINEVEVIPGCRARFVHSDNTTISYWNLDLDAVIPDHSHPHEQVTTIIEGEMELTVDGEMQCVTPGTVAVIPSNSSHSVRALTKCYVIDVFYPIREDYR